MYRQKRLTDRQEWKHYALSKKLGFCIYRHRCIERRHFSFWKEIKESDDERIDKLLADLDISIKHIDGDKESY